MSIVSMKELLGRARKEKYAVGAFNVFNIETVQAVIAAAEREGYPLILPLSESHIKFSDWEIISRVMKNQAERAGIPVCLQLDHAKKIETVVRALEAGFGCVMFDGYDLSFEEKMRETAEVAAMAHKRGALAEAPLGRINTVGVKTEAKYAHDDFTDPSLVREFTQKTGVDILAVSVGTIHGNKAGESTLDFPRLNEICQNTDAFISLHGGSGVGDESYRKAIGMGVNKISIFTRMSTAAVDSIVSALNGKRMRFPELLVEAKKGVADEAARLMKIFSNR
jgi:fructose-bisphosphate aldolase class II